MLTSGEVTNCIITALTNILLKLQIHRDIVFTNVIALLCGLCMKRDMLFLQQTDEKLLHLGTVGDNKNVINDSFLLYK